RGRPESEFDPDVVFGACAEHGVAVEVNSRPERQDPPKRLLRLAVERDCRSAIDTDAHAPGQLDWQLGGCERAFACGVTADMVVNTRDAAGLLAWAGRHRGWRSAGVGPAPARSASTRVRRSSLPVGDLGTWS